MQKKFMTTVLAISLIAIMMVGMQMESAEAKKSKGNFNTHFGSATKHIVCGDMLCSEIDSSKQIQKTVTKSINKPMITSSTCSSYSIQIESSCANFRINGATVQSSTHDKSSGSTTLVINALNDGTFTINASNSILESIFVLVDGEESDDIIINHSKMTIEFLAGTDTIEIFGN